MAVDWEGVAFLAVGFVLFVVIGTFAVHQRMKVQAVRARSRPQRVAASTRGVFPIPPPYQPDYVAHGQGLRALGRAGLLFLPALVFAAYISGKEDAEGRLVIGADGDLKDGLATLGAWLVLAFFVYVAGYIQSQPEDRTYSSRREAKRGARRISRGAIVTVIVFGLIAVVLAFVAERVVTCGACT